MEQGEIVSRFEEEGQMSTPWFSIKKDQPLKYLFNFK